MRALIRSGWPTCSGWRSGVEMRCTSAILLRFAVYDPTTLEEQDMMSRPVQIFLAVAAVTMLVIYFTTK